MACVGFCVLASLDAVCVLTWSLSVSSPLSLSVCLSIALSLSLSLCLSVSLY